MPTYRVTDPTTNKTVKLTGDSPPTEQELEQIFSTINKQPTPQEVGLPNLPQVEKQIAQRPSAMRELIKSEFPQTHKDIVLKALKQTIPSAYGFAPTYEAIESTLANVGLDLQRGKVPISSQYLPRVENIARQTIPQLGVLPPRETIPNVYKGLIGQRPAQIGDIMRTTGFGGKYNEPLSAVIGTLAMGAIPSFITEGKFEKGTKEVIKQSPISDLVFSVKRKAHLLKATNKENLAIEVQNALVNKKTKLIESFGEQYKNIMKSKQGKQISLAEPLNNLLENADDIVNTLQGQEDLQKSLSLGDPMAKRVLSLINSVTDPEKKIPQTLSIEEADVLQKYIRQLPSIRTKLEQAYKRGFEQVNWTNAERILLDFASDMKKQVLDLSPELGALKMNYGQVMTDIKRIRPNFAWGKAIRNMENFHLLDPQIRSAIERILPSNIINKIKDLSSAVRITNLLKRMGIGIGVGVGIGVGSRVLRK